MGSGGDLRQSCGNNISSLVLLILPQMKKALHPMVKSQALLRECL
jgi:hypothetical protein